MSKLVDYIQLVLWRILLCGFILWLALSGLLYKIVELIANQYIEDTEFISNDSIRVVLLLLLGEGFIWSFGRFILEGISDSVD